MAPTRPQELHVMRRHHHRRLRPTLPHQPRDLATSRRIERRRRLVQQHQRPAREQREGEREAALLAAAEVVGVAGREVGGQADAGEHVGGREVGVDGDLAGDGGLGEEVLGKLRRQGGEAVVEVEGAAVVQEVVAEAYVPASGLRNPAAAASRVLLPQPLGPVMPMRSPGCSVRVTPAKPPPSRKRQPTRSHVGDDGRAVGCDAAASSESRASSSRRESAPAPRAGAPSATAFPACSTSTRSAVATSSRRCVAHTSVPPVSARQRRNRSPHPGRLRRILQGRRFVREQQLRPAAQHHRELQPLLLPGRQHARIVRLAAGEPPLGERRADVEARPAQRDLLAHRRGHDLLVRILEHQPRGHGRGGGEMPQQGRLPRPVAPHHREVLAAPQDEIEPVEHAHLAVRRRRAAGAGSSGAGGCRQWPPPCSSPR